MRAFLLASATAILVGGVLAHGAARAADFSVCIDSASAAAARDQALAESVARQEDLTLSVHKFDGSGEDEGFGVKEFRALLAKSCDLVLGFPVDTTGGEAPPGLSMTSPYDQTGFGLVTANAAPANTLADLPKDTDVAVTYGTVPNLYFPTHHNIASDIHLSEAETLKALTDGHVKAAMVWQPTWAQYEAANPSPPFSFHPLAEPHARWNIVAIYAPKGAAAARQFEDGLAALRKPRHAALHFGHLPRRPFVDLAAVTVKEGNAAVAGVPALYTAAQAKSGAAKYDDQCAQCHGPTLEGQSGPALKGELFASVKTGFSVGDILTFMAINMPATQPGSLSHDDYTDIMSYVLQQNGFPAGTAALSYEDGMKSKVPLLYHGK